MFLVDDVLAGAIKSITWRDESISQKIRRQCRSTLRIWQGLFTGTFTQVLSRFTWEIIQTVIGFITAHFANLFLPVERVCYFYGTTVLEGAGIRGSVCMGTYILLYPGRKTGGEVCMHEFGHTLQSRLSGPLYFLKYGICSALRNRSSWVEPDANVRVAGYFGLESGFAGSGRWPMAATEINPKWWEYLLFFLGVGIIVIPVLNYQEGM